MSMLKMASTQDWAALAIGLIGAVLGLVRSQDRLPKWARRWLARIGRDRVESAIEYAAKMSGLSSDERRREAAAYLMRLSEKEIGFAIPESIANLLVEYIYQQWKRK
jgi:hypothetical protein